jgi:hypothetical protein
MLSWNGDQIKARMRNAAVGAIDDTMDAAVVLAAAAMPRESGKTAGSVEVLHNARQETGGRVVGRWGSRYFLAYIWEVGSFRKPSGWTIRPRKKRALADKAVLYGASVHHPPIVGRAPMRRAADAIYPILAARLGMRFRRGRR